MSISKSVVGCVVGNLVDRGLLSPTHLVTDHVPELEHSGYRGATLRDVLDMRSGVDFSEDYTDLDAEVRVMEEAMGWRPASHRNVPSSMYAYLTTLGGAGEHGGVLTTVPARPTSSGGSASGRRRPGWPTSSASSCGRRWAPSMTPRSPVTAWALRFTTEGCALRRATSPVSA